MTIIKKESRNLCSDMQGKKFTFSFKNENGKILQSSNSRSLFDLVIPKAMVRVGADSFQTVLRGTVHIAISRKDVMDMQKDMDKDIRDVEWKCSVLPCRAEVTKCLPFIGDGITIVVDRHDIISREDVTIYSGSDGFDVTMQGISFDFSDPVVGNMLAYPELLEN